MKDDKKNFNKKVKMHLACADDELRPALACIYFKNDFAYASDGHILVRNRLSEISNFSEEEIQALDGKFLSAKSYKEILKYDDVLISEDGLECSKGDDKVFFYFKNMQGTKYPNAEKIIEQYLNKQTQSVYETRFNIKLMSRMNEALHDANSCKAIFKNDCIVFFSLNDTVSSVGLIMQISQ